MFTSNSLIPNIPFLTDLDTTYENIFGNPPSHWIVAIFVAVFTMSLLQFVFRTMLGRMQRIAAKTDNKFDDVLADVLATTRRWFWIVFGLYLGSLLLEVGAHTQWIQRVLMIAILLQAGIWLVALLNSGLKQWHGSRDNDQSLQSVMIAFRYIGQVVIWSVVVLLILDNFGVKVASLLAGLGVGGIAVALAVQRVLGDLLASISIILDKPFEIGDTIDIGSMVGTVEHIGLKTTRVRASSGEQLIVSNSDLLNSRIRNLKRMKERRNVMTFGIPYETDPKLVEQVPVWIQTVIEAQPQLRFDRAHLQKFGDSALIFEVVYWVTTPDMSVHMDSQQAVNLELLRKFRTEGVELAYPTQMHHVRAGG